jgi:elongation factor Ts
MYDEHVIESYVHNGRIAVLVELSAESDFATRTDEFKSLAREIAMHVAAASPESVSSLLEQPFVKRPELSIGELIANASASLRERICVTRFVRWDTTSAHPKEPEPPKTPAVAMRSEKRA